MTQWTNQNSSKKKKHKNKGNPYRGRERYAICAIAIWHLFSQAPSGNGFLAPSIRRRNLKTEVSLWKRIKCFPFTLGRRNLKRQKWPVILDLCLRKTRAGKSRDYSDVIVVEKLRFQSVFRPHENEKPVFSNSTALKSVFFPKSCVFVTD